MARGTARYGPLKRYCTGDAAGGAAETEPFEDRTRTPFGQELPGWVRNFGRALPAENPQEGGTYVRYTSYLFVRGDT
jgi:hypothetical protein